jgi:hypothetical protein
VAGLTNPYNFNIASCRMAGINADEVSEVELYPNPTTLNSVLKFSSEIESDFSLVLSDISGRKIWSKIDVSHVGINNIEIPVEQLSSGIYLLSFTFNGEINNLKLVKE